MAKTPVKKVKKSTAVAKSDSSRQRPSRVGKFTRKLDRIKVSNLDASKSVFSVRIVATNAPVQLPGIILSMNDGNCVVQHLKSGSSKELVSHIPTSQIIQCVGGIGEKSLITYLGDLEVDFVKRANVNFDAKIGAYTVRDVDTGDTSMIFKREGVNVIISGDASAAAGSVVKSKKKKLKD